jgi:PST family polysaccharide transporter
MASQRQATLATLWRTVERGATQGISFLVVVVLARLLGPSDYGLVALAASVAALGQMLLEQTFSEALIQARTVEPPHVSSVFWMLLCSGLIAAGVLLIAADWFGELFGVPELPPVLRALSPLMVLTALYAVPAAMFRRDLDFRALAKASMSGSFLGGAVAVPMAFAGFGAWSLVANLLVQKAVVTAEVWRHSGFRPRLLYSHRHLMSLWSYGQYTFLLRVAAYVAAQGPRMLIGYLFGTAALGAFSFGLRMVDTLYQLLTLPAANVMVPVVARIRDEPKRFERAVLSATMLVATITVPIFVGLSLIAPVAVPLLFGQHWAESAVILQIIGFVGISNSIAQINRSVLAGLGRPDINLAMNVTAAIANVGLVLLTAPWGLTATAIAFVARGYVVMPIVLVVMTRLTGIGVAAQARVYCPVAVAAAVMALCVEGLLRGLGAGLSPAALTAAAVACGAASYVLALCLFGRPALKLGASILADLRPRQKPA